MLSYLNAWVSADDLLPLIGEKRRTGLVVREQAKSHGSRRYGVVFRS